jgi:GT2 family glycosyltransferase
LKPLAVRRITLRPVRLSLVIATRGRPERLARTLDSLARCDPLPAELIVVDGDPEGSAAPVLAGRSLGVPATHLTSPPGLTRQRNAAVDAASGDVVVFADDDVDFDPPLFARLAEAYADPGLAGATVRVITADEDARVGGARSRLRRLLGGREGTMTRYGYPRRIVDPEIARDVEFMAGCLMSARRELAARLRFDEALGGYGLAEDEDFGYRLSRVGRVRYLPSTHVVHHGGGVQAVATAAFNRQLVVNRTYLFRKNFAATPLARAQFALMLALLLVHRAVNREWAGARGLLQGVRDALTSGERRAA